MSLYLIRHRLPGRDHRGMDRFDLYLAAERPERTTAGVQFTGWRTDYVRAHGGAATGLRLAESAPRWRDLPGAKTTVEEPPAHLMLPVLEPLRRVA